jgi:hypothetical protein
MSALGERLASTGSEVEVGSQAGLSSFQPMTAVPPIAII